MVAFTKIPIKWKENSMKTRIKKLISIGSIPVLALALLVVLGTVLADDEHDRGPIAAIAALGNQYAVACNTGDIELYMSLWDDNGIQMPPDEPARIGKEAIRAGMAPGFELFDLEMTITSMEEFRVVGNYAFTIVTYTLDLTPKDVEDPPTIHVDGKALTVYKRQADGWRPGPAAGWKFYIDCFNSNVP